jgi:hypothetical protein
MGPQLVTLHQREFVPVADTIMIPPLAEKVSLGMRTR